MKNESNQLSNPENYTVLIQIKKNRRLRRKARYLNENLDFTEDINQAKLFQDIYSAEEILPIISSKLTHDCKPRIIIKYLDPVKKPEGKTIKERGEFLCQG